MRLWYLPLLRVIIIVMHGIKCEFLYQFWTFLHHFCTSDFCSPACFCERFEPRSHFLSRLSMIIRVNVVLNRAVVVDSDWRFDNLSSSHLQSQSELYHTMPVDGIDTTHFDSEDDYTAYRTGCRNNNSPIQVYVHPDNRTQLTYLMFLLSIWFNVCRP